MWLRMAPNVSKWLQNAQNCLNLLHKAQHGSKWLQMAPDGFKWLPMAPKGSKLRQKFVLPVFNRNFSKLLEFFLTAFGNLLGFLKFLFDEVKIISEKRNAD